MPPKRNTRSGSAAATKKTPSKPAATRTPAAKATRSTTKRAKTPVTTSTRTTRSRAKREGSVVSTDLNESVAGYSTVGSPEAEAPVDSFETIETIEEDPAETAFSEVAPSEAAVEHEVSPTVDSAEEQNAIATIEEEESSSKTVAVIEEEECQAVAIIEDESRTVATVDDEEESSAQDGMPLSFSMEEVLEGPTSLVNELTVADKQALILSMRDEINRLRKAVEDMSQKALPTPSPIYTRRQIEHKHIDRSKDLRFQISIAKPAAILAAAEAEEQLREQQARQEQELQEAAAASAKSPEQSQLPRRSLQVIQSSSPKLNSPQMAASSPIFSDNVTKPQTPPAATPASPWGLRTIFSSVSRVFGRSPAQSQENTPPQHSSQTSSQQENQPQSQHDSHPKLDFSSPEATMTPNMTPSRRSRHKPKTPKAPESPTPAQNTSETPIRSVRRRGNYPGSVTRTRATSTPRQKPVEPNADKRAQNLEQAAERKRIQDQADKLEEEMRKADDAQRQLDQKDSAAQQVGNKRKRVRVDDLKEIPARLPGQSSGCFSFREEFFMYDSDSDGDDYVEMDIEEAEELVVSRPVKKMRMEDNVFQSVTPQKTAPSQLSQPTPTPSTPTPALSQQNTAALERQRIQASQHKPKRPSGLRQVSNGPSPVTAGPTPRQISAATPAPVYYQTPGPLGDITEITEPADTPAPSRNDPVSAPTPPFIQAPAPSLAPSPSPAPAPKPSSSLSAPKRFNFPSPVDLWVSFPELYTPESVQVALVSAPITPKRLITAKETFAAGCNRLLQEQSRSISAS